MQKIVYIAAPIAGDVQANLAYIRKIVHTINTLPKYATVVPFVPYYADVVSMDDNIPEQRARGLKNGQTVLTRPGVVDEVWMCGPVISKGMAQEAFAAWDADIKVVGFDSNIDQVEKLKQQWKNSKR